MSWWELKEFLLHECRDQSSAFFRKLSPDWESTELWLARFTAQAVADLRWVSGLKFVDEGGGLPESLARFGLYDFDQSSGDDVEPEMDQVESARAAAAELLG